MSRLPVFLDYLYFNLKKQLFGDNLIKSSLAGGRVVLVGEGVLGCRPPIPPRCGARVLTLNEHRCCLRSFGNADSRAPSQSL